MLLPGEAEFGDEQALEVLGESVLLAVGALRVVPGLAIALEVQVEAVDVLEFDPGALAKKVLD